MKNEVNRALVAKKHSILKVIGATLLLYSSTPLLLTSCAPKAPHNPIMPIHLTGDMTTVLLTDYIPGNPDTIFIEGNKLNVIRQGKTDIVALPNLPIKQGMITLSCSEGQVHVGFTQPVHHPQFVVMRNNKQLKQYEYNEQTQELTIFLGRQPMGRQFLRVYAVDGDTLFNDLLIPLKEGQPITNSSNLNRHDDNAQVLYSLLVDRFNNGNKENDWKINSPEVLDIVDYQGGDLAGITAKI